MDDCKMYLRISLKTVILIMVLILPLIFRKIAQTPLLVLGALGSSTILVLILAFHVEARELPSYHQTREIMNKSLLHHCSKSTEAQRRKNRMEVVMHMISQYQHLTINLLDTLVALVRSYLKFGIHLVILKFQMRPK